MVPLVDYHMHTHLCGHATGQPQDYARHAIAIGLEEIGFSDHAPRHAHFMPGITMDRKQLPEYHKMIESVCQTYQDQLRVRTGIEADFVPGHKDKTKEILDLYPYDYVIGSVHYIQDWGFDNLNERQRWEGQDVTAVYRNYYALLRQSAQSGLFDIMGHVDLVKKFGYRPTGDVQDEIEKTAKVFKETGVVIEINTSGLRKPVKEIYPAPGALKIYANAGVPITFGADAHNPNDVGRDFDKALELAKTAGYTEYVLFKKRKIEKSIKF